MWLCLIPRFYSQFGEDKAIYPLFCQQSEGYYVDLGAYDGVFESNTYVFEQLGWRGVCVEPSSIVYKYLCENRPKCLNIKAAVWNSNRDTCNFHILERQGWSRMEGTLHPEQDSPLVSVEHPATLTLNRILEHVNVPTGFELLSIDVEGSESQVLEGFYLERYMPRIVIIESWGKVGFDDYFVDYTPVYSWEQGVRGTNIIYCREPMDAEVVKHRWHK